jgi:hypothetical protein
MFRLINVNQLLRVCLVSAAAGFGAPSQAAELLILASSGGEFVRDCANRDVVISGSNSKFILAGGCQSLTIPGDGNQILADMAAESEILLRGNENNVARTNTTGGDHLKIHTDGRFNQVVKLDGSPKQPDVREANWPKARRAGTRRSRIRINPQNRTSLHRARQIRARLATRMTAVKRGPRCISHSTRRGYHPMRFTF